MVGVALALGGAVWPGGVEEEEGEEGWWGEGEEVWEVGCDGALEGVRVGGVVVEEGCWGLGWRKGGDGCGWCRW